MCNVFIVSQFQSARALRVTPDDRHYSSVPLSSVLASIRARAVSIAFSLKIFIVCYHLDLSTSALTWSGLSLCKHDRGTRNGQRTARVNLKERHPPRGTWQNFFRKRYIRTRQLFRTTSSAVLMSAFQSFSPNRASRPLSQSLRPRNRRSSVENAVKNKSQPPTKYS
jgi:hypothetical protein